MFITPMSIFSNNCISKILLQGLLLGGPCIHIYETLEYNKLCGTKNPQPIRFSTGFITEQCFTVPLRKYPNFRKWEKYFFFIGSFGIEGAVFATGRVRCHYIEGRSGIYHELYLHPEMRRRQSLYRVDQQPGKAYKMSQRRKRGKIHKIQTSC